MRKFLNWLTAGFAAFFSIPTFLILISWNAIPGDSLYGLKTALEDVALAVTIKTPLASTLSVSYTERRFSEANVLLSQKGSTVGYKLLIAETNDSKEIIVDKKDSKQATQLVNKIEVYQKDIQEKKQLIQQGRLAIPTQEVTRQPEATTVPSIKTPAPTLVPTVKPPSVTSTPKPTAPPVVTPDTSDDEVLENLEEAEEELEKIKQEVKRSLPQSAAPQAQEAIEGPRGQDDDEIMERGSGRDKKENGDDDHDD